MRRRNWFSIHSWIGVIGGLLLFVLSWSGSFAVVANEIDWLLTPTLRVEPRGDRVPLEQLHASVAAAYPEARVGRVHAPLYPRSAAHAVVDLPGQRLVRVYVDPYSARVLGHSSYFSVQRFFRSFHIHLFNGRWGLYLVWLMALPLLVATLAPLIFYRRWWRRFLELRTGRGARVLWSDLHKLAGLWSLWFALLIALTGVWFLYEAVRQDLIDGKSTWVSEGKSAVNRLPALERGAPLPVAELAARAREARPDLQVCTIGLDRGGYFYVDGQDDTLLVRDRANKLYLDARDGRVAYNQRASELSLYWRWSDTADPLHFGDFGGLASKVAWFALGLLLSGLCLTGAYLHGRRLALGRAGRRKTTWPGTSAAVLATALVLTSSVRGGWNEIRRFGPMVDSVQHWPDLPIAIIAFIGTWIAITLGALAWWAFLVRRP
jgi:uncharacterized iron-regulated membrane protein